jgi:hypothetical protein
MAYWKRYGIKRVHEVCEAAGTNYDYWKLIAYGFKRPSVDLAHRLVEQSNGEMGFIDLLPPSDELKKMLASRKAQAAAKAATKTRKRKSQSKVEA